MGSERITKYLNSGYSVDGERVGMIQYLFHPGPKRVGFPIKVFMIKVDGAYKRVEEDEFLAFVSRKAKEAQDRYDEAQRVEED
jgi:hypothetical protein